jgi:16S rRNA (guanine527-N7)-methyltransferase
MSDESGIQSVLARAQELGFLGPGPIEPHIDHARRFAQAFDGPPPSAALDLGSGGGLPGLVLALGWPGSRWTLVDANDRRTAFLNWAVEDLGLNGRVAVIRGRAEELAHGQAMRAHSQLVTARSFGPPAVTAECASGFLAVGGVLIVSEPPGGEQRWNTQGLAELGLQPGPSRDGCQVLVQETACPERYPRRVGIPAKRPLF